jgi:hypothetical protein|tara:strand:+ start:1311 stop:1772 length:462 start_codon:yes stop_codon:yes gene_type:complete
MSVISDLAAEIFSDEFDSDSNVNTSASIQAWLENNLGELNNLIYQDFSGAGAALDIEAQSIHKELYLHNYYNKQTRNALRGIASAANDDKILSLKDGESSVTFVNRNEVAKVYRGLANDSKANLDGLVAKYNIYEAAPQQVGGIDAVILTGES